MTETQRRIKAYQKALPELRERVIAVALLLAMSASMLSSASFAWITLSTAPEVSSMSTTVAANGNLEIALAQGPTTSPAAEPRDSAVGDSAAKQGIVNSNTTWGNLINVSDPIYGLQEIALRPAVLNGYNRTKYPLNGAAYGEDGRVVDTKQSYEFASYGKVEGTTVSQFFAGNKVNYGVRAISSVGYKTTGENQVDPVAESFLNAAWDYYQKAHNHYRSLVSDGNDAMILEEGTNITCLTALEGLVAVFAQDKVNEMGFGPSGTTAETKTSCSEYIPYVYRMMQELMTVLDNEGEALLKLANWQAYASGAEGVTTETYKTVDELLAATNLSTYKIKLTSLANYKSNRNSLRSCISQMEPWVQVAKEGRINPETNKLDYSVYWDNIASCVSPLVDINNTLIIAGDGTQIKLGNVSGVSSAMTVLQCKNVVVTGGILKDIDLRTIPNDRAYRLNAGVSVTVRTNIPFFTNTTVSPTVWTSAGWNSMDSTHSADYGYSRDMTSSNKGEATALDTYGLALDVWVRTNYPNAVLTLEGSAVYEENDVYITVQETNGDKTEEKQYLVHTVEINEAEHDVYKKEDGTWYYASTHEAVAAEDMDGKTPSKKVSRTVVGYEGENRVWEDWRDLLDGGYIERDATTQGAGSCFVFYADTPTEQAKIMEMLEAFTVVFMDEDGEQYGTAELDMENHYANQGKVTIPLKMWAGTEYVDADGQPQTGITQLVQNEPTFITAVVYLNGTELKNENVLAAGELNGQLNIQFGTNAVLIAPDNEELQSQARTITATVTVTDSMGTVKGSVSDGTIGGEDGLPYDANGYKATVTLAVVGEQPQKIEGFFVRVINASQGTRGDNKTFTKNENGTWTAVFDLSDPGTYAFNTLLVDGVQYTLHDGTVIKTQNELYPSNRPGVSIQGLKLNGVETHVEVNGSQKGPGTHMTADTSVPMTVSANITAAVTPSQVNAQFFSEDNSKMFTALLTRSSDGKTWTGTANINQGGTYTLKYISVDGNILDVTGQGSYTLYLGISARVTTTVPEKSRIWQYDPKKPTVQLPMRVEIYDDGFNPIKNLTGVKLYYQNITNPAELNWNANGYYENKLSAVGVGVFSFSSLSLGNLGMVPRNQVYSAPVFTSISPEPPAFVEGRTSDQQTVIQTGKTAYMDLRMDENSTAAKIAAEITDPSGDKHYILGTNDALITLSNQTFRFTLPHKEDGVWTLTKLYCQDVYDPETETMYKYEPAENATVQETFVGKSYIIDDFQDITTEVIANVYTTVKYGGKTYVGYTNNDYLTGSYSYSDLTGENAVILGNTTSTPFMNPQSTTDLSVTVEDYKHRAIPALKSVTWTIDHDQNTMELNGGYTGPGYGKNMIALTAAEQGTTYTVGAQAISVAGVYATKVELAFDWDPNDNAQDDIRTVWQANYTVKSKHPTLSIKSISPEGKHKTLARGFFSATEKDVTSKIDGNTITIYAKGIRQNRKNVLQEEPKVTLTFTGLGNAQKAVLKFTSSESSVRMYYGTSSKNGTQTAAYTWDKDTGTDVMRFIGYNDAGNCDASKVAGTLTSSNVVELTYKDQIYNVAVSTITIINKEP